LSRPRICSVTITISNQENYSHASSLPQGTA
jgi:hypothetical protein